MTEVLLVATSRPQFGVLADAVAKLNALGARVHLGGSFHLEAEGVPEELAKVALAEAHQLPRSLKHRSQALRRRLGKSPRGLRQWVQVKGDSWLRSRARRADVLVALDVGAVYTVWRLAEYNRTAPAKFGIAPALKAVEELRAQGGAAARKSSVLPPLHAVARDVRRGVDQLPAQLVRAATPRPVMRSGVGARLWRSAVTAPGVPIKVRAATSRYVAEGMQWAGRTSGAALTLADAAAKIPDLSLRADLYYEATMQEIRKGLSPRGLGKAVKAQLAVADAEFAKGRNDEAAEALNRALFLHFHRVVHIDQLSSPLAKDAEGFVAPLHKSKAFQAVSRPRGRKVPAAPLPADRPLRLLVTTSANDNFLHLIKKHFADHPGVELRYLDLAANKHLKRISWAATRMLKDRLSDGTSDYQEEVERLMRPHLDWADTVFLEWAAGPAGMLTSIDPGDTRIVVRLHSYEAFTRWPHMTDFSRVDVAGAGAARRAGAPYALHRQRHEHVGLQPAEAGRGPLQPGPDRHQPGRQGPQVGPGRPGAGAQARRALPAAAGGRRHGPEDQPGHQGVPQAVRGAAGAAGGVRRGGPARPDGRRAVQAGRDRYDPQLLGA